MEESWNQLQENGKFSMNFLVYNELIRNQMDQ